MPNLWRAANGLFDGIFFQDADRFLFILFFVCYLFRLMMRLADVAPNRPNLKINFGRIPKQAIDLITKYE